MPSFHLISACAVAIVTGLVGGIYISERPVRYVSSAQVILVPQGEPTAELVNGFDRSGSLGNFVEFLASASLRREVSGFRGDVEVRAVPDSRVITVRVTGPSDARDQLAGLLDAAVDSQRRLRDAWRLKSLDAPSNPTRAGPTTGVLVGAAILLAFLAGLAVSTLLRALNAGK